jgi:hypothetical protein
LPTTPSVSVISQIPKIINDYRSEFLWNWEILQTSCVEKIKLDVLL